MKITPLEIRQKEFEKGFRGYDKDEVNAYLTSLSQEWERVMDEQKELRLKLEAAEKEVAKLREVESSLYKTLKTAEDTGANVIEQANKSAELHLKETQMRAEAILNEAKNKGNAIIEEASNKARTIIEDMEEEVKNLARTYRELENHRDNLFSDLKHVTTDINEKVRKVEEKQQAIDVEQHLKNARNAVRRVMTDGENFNVEEADQKAEKEKKNGNAVESAAKPKKNTPKEEAASEHKEGDDSTSFFDELE